jgi:hypothetical protein
MALIYYTLAITFLFLVDAQSAIGTALSAVSSSAPVTWRGKRCFSNAGDIPCKPVYNAIICNAVRNVFL